jgi:hypothetical protein
MTFVEIIYRIDWRLILLHVITVRCVQISKIPPQLKRAGTDSEIGAKRSESGGDKGFVKISTS